MSKIDKAIVTTTINPPTKALKNFAKCAKDEGWQLIIVGDQKTPHEPYLEMAKNKHITYLSPQAQEKISKELSDLIGWNCIQRRNFGLIEAYRQGAEIIATIDDDNLPYAKWGQNLKVNKEVEAFIYDTKQIVFDPLSPIYPHIWHRGFPIQLLDDRSLSPRRLEKRKVLVQADLWDGDPDVDAVCRITLAPQVKDVATATVYGSNKPMPFNSQNTFLSRDIFPTYFLFPHIGRMDDIWAAYYTQSIFKDSVVFAKASVYQERNPHDLSKDLEAEMIGYKHSKDFIEWCQSGSTEWPDYMPKKSIEAFNVYRSLFDAKTHEEKDAN